MAAGMARQESYAYALDLPEKVRIRRSAERGVDGHLTSILEKLIEPGPADDADVCRLGDCGHKRPPFPLRRAKYTGLTAGHKLRA
jgi:hypothetical protein